ncbi:MAG: SWIM zinc finger family protein [Snowella sp.]|nr:SWIM zinc finger family protein [Snowella sp.]
MTNYQIDNRQWWVQRWLELLDSYRFKKRLERARNYAREGNILSIEFENAQVLAKVQGSEIDPYQVSLKLDLFTDEDWHYVVSSLAEKAIYSAQLLAGQMPESIEQVFIKNGLNLFPFSLSDIHSRCSCPDKANPCKHIGAIYYQLADRFSEDPFVIFQLRGRTKPQILSELRQLRSQVISLDKENNQDAIADHQNVLNPERETPSEPPPLAKKSRKKTSSPKADTVSEINHFWHYDEPLDPSLVVITPPAGQKDILELLGMLPLPYEEAQEAKQSLQQIYQAIGQKALMLALGQEE